jgi:hypothetical protein
VTVHAEPARPDRTAWIKGLREMADFLEAHPEAIKNYDTVTLTTFPADIKAIARAGYGRLGKEFLEDYLYLTKHFTSRVCIQWIASRTAACRRVKVGERIIKGEPERIVPAQPERVIPATVETKIAATPDRVEDVMEWDCKPLLGEDEPTTLAALPAGEVIEQPTGESNALPNL